MQYRKIHIIGGPGSGKTFSAAKLQQVTGLNGFDLDSVFWEKNEFAYVRSSEHARTEKLNHILSHDNWIVEGVYYKWLASLFRDADLIVILNPPTLLRQWRIFKRFLKRKFVLGHYQKESLASFLQMFWWNQGFDQDNMVRILDFIHEYEDKIIYCKNYNEIWRELSK
ncbi:DNA topology modulation protein FlaR [Pseudoalteromonas sp. MMG013]|uniref:DNA topology modulation protein FlaR n=1 Tax=Pseudoalteromonas sp. MMG013 TaxID=2822687 RepID=UPI001FFC6305|nr:DNA topology modulation protein FlaR [Pseudoalteromonas sp. MMG013]